MSFTFRRTAASVAILSLLASATLAHGASSPQHLELHLQKRAISYDGCYTSGSTFQSVGTFPYQSSGHCTQQCTTENKAVAAMSNGNECYCGDELPPTSDQTEDSACNVQCTGWTEACGGKNEFSVWLTGLGSNVKHADGTSTTAPPTVVTSSVVGGQTVFVTTTPSAKNTNAADNGGGSNTAGIAAGVVVGVVALGAIIGGAFFFLRNRKRKQAEEEFKQRSQVNDFIRGGKERKAANSVYSGLSDQRLDPEAGRRNSVGSLADNQDYTRRILRVANPDSS